MPHANHPPPVPSPESSLKAASKGVLTDDAPQSSEKTIVEDASMAGKAQAPESTLRGEQGAVEPSAKDAALESGTQEKEASTNQMPQGNHAGAKPMTQGKVEATAQFTRSSTLENLLDFEEAERRVQKLLEIWASSQPLFMVRANSSGPLQSLGFGNLTLLVSITGPDPALGRVDQGLGTD